jgi:excisionase family DNA binding protein
MDGDWQTQKEASSAEVFPGANSILTVDEVALLLKLEPGTIRDWARKKKLPGFKIGKMWRFKRADVSKFLEIFQSQVD